ncbi:MAG: transposase [Planctomycetes bacterium]|nr:transposase [Planctomycetota bacterium]
MATHGIHWIATTFGTWLHGDPRGSWRDGKLLGPDPFLEAAIQSRMTADAMALSEEEISLVAKTFGEAVIEHSWPVYAATVHPTHTHIVFAPMRDDIAKVIATLKKRSANIVMEHHRKQGKPVGRSLWTEGQFPVFIFDERHLENAIAYVQEHNLRVGRRVDPYPWIGHVPPW